MRIEQVIAREVFDSRGKPTVEVDVYAAGARGRAIVPSGASTGKFEALELRDRDSARLDGDGVTRAVRHVNERLAPAVIGLDADRQTLIDETLRRLDGAANKSNLGANALLGVSLASAHAAAAARGCTLAEHLHELFQQTPRPSLEIDSRNQARTALLGKEMSLPLPMVNMISGGRHAGGYLDFQDFLAIPVGAASYREGFDWIVTVYRRLGKLLDEAGYEGVLVGDEGGYGPKLPNHQTAVEFLLRAIEAAGRIPGEEIALGLDVASTEFYRDGVYTLRAEAGRRLHSSEMVDLLCDWCDKYPIISIEDGLAEEDWSGWQELTDRLGGRAQLIGDDLFVTHPARLAEGISRGAANSVLVKVNQIGTLSETLQTVRLAIDAGYWPVISARSGETEDATIADLAVGLGAGQIKIGSVARSERLAKYNQLLRLDEQLGSRAVWRGGAIFDELRRPKA